MHACISHQNAEPGFQTLYDNQYFYVENEVGYCVCGIARAFMAKFLRKNRSDHFLTPAWLDSYKHFKKNQAMLGFLVEQSCLSFISTNGLLGFVPGAENVKYFNSEYPVFDTTKKCAIYIPDKFNFKAIDGLILSLETSKKSGKNAYVIPFQITIARKHNNKDSATAFRNEWTKWGPSQLKGFNIHILFTWIWEKVDDHTLSTMPAELKNNRNGANYMIKEKLTEYNISIMDLNARIGEALEIRDIEVLS